MVRELCALWLRSPDLGAQTVNIVSIVLIAALLIPVAVVLLDHPLCGAYDPPGYRCGKCDICRRASNQDRSQS